MFKKLVISLALLTASPNIFTNPATIKAVFVDINVLFTTDTLKAMKYINTWDATKYTFKMKHKPSQADLFSALMAAPAESTVYTYNENLKMPLLFSDWLLGTESPANIEKKALKFIQFSRISDIEKKVLSDIVRMMLNPTSLANTQKIVPSAISMMSDLTSKGYTIYIVGNWADSISLKQAFTNVFSYAKETITSHEINTLKPETSFYEAAMKQAQSDINSSVWVEKETQFVSKAKQLGLKVVNAEAKHLYNEFKTVGITL